MPLFLDQRNLIATFWLGCKGQAIRPRARGHSGFPLGLISDSNFQNGGLNERATVCGIGRLVAAA